MDEHCIFQKKFFGLSDLRQITSPFPPAMRAQTATQAVVKTPVKNGLKQFG
jgi:hypothetical protein